MRAIQLLEQKNHFLEQLFSLNELQLNLLQAGEVETLDEFYEKREKILEIFRYLDHQIEQALADWSQTAHGNQEAWESERKNMAKLFHIKDEYVARIMDQELMILSCIDQIKNSILNELMEIQTQKKVLRGYHSKNAEAQIKEKA